MVRVRLGIILIVLSWLPFAQLFIHIAHSHNKLASSAATDEFRLVVWGIQIVVGLVGVWLVGEVAVKAAKEDGWKHIPAKIWHLFWNG
jgi:hypothetical protein